MPAVSCASRYQLEQRITIAGWAALVAIGALTAAAYHHWSAARSMWSGSNAVSPIAPAPNMRTWLDQTQLSISQVVNARNKIAAAASRRDIPATGAACRVAADTVATLRNHMPSPEATVNQPLQQAISSYTLGLPHCVSASQAEGGEGMQAAARFISEGDSAMQLALDTLADEQSDDLGVLVV